MSFLLCHTQAPMLEVRLSLAGKKGLSEEGDTGSMTDASCMSMVQLRLDFTVLQRIIES